MITVASVPQTVVYVLGFISALVNQPRRLSRPLFHETSSLNILLNDYSTAPSTARAENLEKNLADGLLVQGLGVLGGGGGGSTVQGRCYGTVLVSKDLTNIPSLLAFEDTALGSGLRV